MLTGDIIVYDLAQGYKVVRVVANTSKAVDPIDNIAWSLDGLKLVTSHIRTVGIYAGGFDMCLCCKRNPDSTLI